MARDIGVDELLEEKQKLEDNITKAVQTDITNFVKKTEVPVTNVVVSVNADSEVTCVLCGLAL